MKLEWKIFRLNRAISIHRLEDRKNYLKFDPGLDWKPMQVLKHRGNVAVLWNSKNDKGGIVLDELQAVNKSLENLTKVDSSSYELKIERSSHLV